MKEPAGAPNREASAFDERPRLRGAITSMVCQELIVGAVEERPRGDAHQQRPTRAKPIAEPAHEVDVVLDVLEDVEGRHEVEGAARCVAYERDVRGLRRELPQLDLVVVRVPAGQPRVRQRRRP